MDSQIKDHFSNLSDNIRSYVDARIQLIKLSAADKVASGASGFVSGFLMLILGLFFLLFVGCSAGFFIGREMDSYAAGFLIVAGFYLLLFVLLLIFRKAMILNPITNFVIKGMLHERKD